MGPGDPRHVLAREKYLQKFVADDRVYLHGVVLLRGERTFLAKYLRRQRYFPYIMEVCSPLNMMREILREPQNTGDLQTQEGYLFGVFRMAQDHGIGADFQVPPEPLGRSN